MRLVLWPVLKCKVRNSSDSVLAGTLQHAELKPGLSASKFPPKLQATLIPESRDSSENKRNAARRSMSRNGFCSALDVINKGDDLFDADIGDADMIAAGLLSSLQLPLTSNDF